MKQTNSRICGDVFGKIDSNMPVIYIQTSVPQTMDFKSWGDLHFANEFALSLFKIGFNVKILFRGEKVNPKNSDIFIVLRGIFPFAPPKNTFNIIWVISHPNQVGKSELKRFNLILTASDVWAQAIKLKIKKPVKVLMQATNNDVFHPEPKRENGKFGIIFVGNSQKRRRKIVHDVISLGYDVEVIGKGWKGKIPDRYIIAESIDNKDIAAIYRRYSIVLNDHWSDMRLKGFISNRIFDAAASGAIVITDSVLGIQKYSENNVFTYRNKKELKLLIEEILNMKIQKNFIKESLAIEFGKNNSFDVRAEEFSQYLKQTIKGNSGHVDRV